jgi:hypothetical protein
MTRPESTGTDLLVLHALRCIGFAGLERVAAATGGSPRLTSSRS